MQEGRGGGRFTLFQSFNAGCIDHRSHPAYHKPPIYSFGIHYLFVSLNHSFDCKTVCQQILDVKIGQIRLIQNNSVVNRKSTFSLNTHNEQSKYVSKLK